MSSHNEVIVKITQNKSCNDWSLDLADVSGSTCYTMKNEYCQASCIPCCGDRYLYMYNIDGCKDGQVVKEWRGCTTECCTSADALLLTFPRGMNAEMKAGMIAAALLSDYN